MRIAVVIPSRLGSTRLPNKALADIHGAPMIVRVWERACLSGADRVVVATEDEAILAAIQAVGGEAVLTGPAQNGTERVAMVAGALGCDVVVNVQGDEPLLDPALVRAVATAVRPEVPITTAAAPLPDGHEDPARVKVVVNRHGHALYFSRMAIPRGGPYRLHLGIYGFYAPLLPTLRALPPSPLEQAESLEQLRWLEAGYVIGVVPTTHAAAGVDTPADLDRVRAAWAPAVVTIQPAPAGSRTSGSSTRIMGEIE